MASIPVPQVDLPATECSEQSAILAAGCFWCVEAVFTRLDGVIEVTSGYAGGGGDGELQDGVWWGGTDHAEVVRVRFDPRTISFGEILQVFFGVAHNPTQLNRQGADVGRQYRSAIFYGDDEQKRVASAYITQLSAAGVFDLPIATTLEPLVEFFPAEDYHQDYAALNPDQPYVACTVPPKLEKLQKVFGERLKKA